MDKTSTTPRKRIDTKELTMLALLAALAYVVMFLSKQIPVNVLGFLNFDLKDVIVCITGFLFGPLGALAVSVVVSFVEMITISSTGIWGFIMNVLSTCALACTAAWFYQRKRTMRNAIIGLVIGVLLMTAVMILWNYLITPIYMKMPRAAVAKLLVPTFLPFNLIKGGINATLTILLYKQVVTALRKAKLVKPSSGSNQGGKKKVGVLIVAAVLLVTFILLALVLAKVI